MNFWTKYLMGQMLLMDEATPPEGKPGGGSPTPDDGNKPKPDDGKGQIDELRSMNAKLMARLEALEGKQTPNPDDDDLAQKAAKERQQKEDEAKKSGKLEAALKFTMGAPEWLKTNESLLPKGVQGIFEQAEKENFANAVEKADSIKVGIVSEFFAVQENVDLLTESQKNTLAEFKKLTKNDKEEKVSSLFSSIFEPTFEMLKRLKKAEQVSKGLGTPSEKEDAYQKRMIELSQKKYGGTNK